MRIAIMMLLATGAAACGGSGAPATPAGTTASVTISYAGATSRRSDLPAAALACADAASPTHLHPSWRGFSAIPLQAVGTDRWELSFSDVPADTVVSFRINDPNACDENATGAVTRNISANNVLLTTRVNTPGNGPEPGFSFSVSRSGQITP